MERRSWDFLANMHHLTLAVTEPHLPFTQFGKDLLEPSSICFGLDHPE